MSKYGCCSKSRVTLAATQNLRLGQLYVTEDCSEHYPSYITFGHLDTTTTGSMRRALDVISLHNPTRKMAI